jgi:hypothetical protein
VRVFDASAVTLTTLPPAAANARDQAGAAISAMAPVATIVRRRCSGTERGTQVSWSV